ncbi:protein FAM169B-like [Sorex fumeus]|uniref:protein FAM169B-like n=1 Tax=Sorex fumeus TaxID=62283 RepID=UPI0024AE71D5|nr:protein FAM169B-like [Sorex fumeus]
MQTEAAGRAAGGYPVDILEDDPEAFRESALAYLEALREGARPPEEAVSLPTGEQVHPEVASVRFCPLHRDQPQDTVLVLVTPRDTKTVVAVYIKERWWPVEETLRTSSPAREGLMEVQSFGERLVLFLLNVVVFGGLERNSDDNDHNMFFLPHAGNEQAKILWRDGAAVGFYTLKRRGSLCGAGMGACYLLPVFDTVFVRTTHRRQGLALAMLQDFCATFPEDEALGISCPISPAMLQVCRKFLLTQPEEQGRLWAVEPPGDWGQRENIWLKVQLTCAGGPGSGSRNTKEEGMPQGRGPGRCHRGFKERSRREALDLTRSAADFGDTEASGGLPEGDRDQRPPHS